jgi:heavy metal translocating P-type ATPase
MVVVKRQPAGSPAQATPGIELDGATILRAWWRIGVAAVVAGQSMVFGLAINLTPPEGSAYWIVHGTLIGAALLVCLLLLPPLVRDAWATLRVRRIAVEHLFLVTLLGALVSSLTATFCRSGAVYYEVVSVLLAIYAAGRTLGARSREKALRAADETRERFEMAERPDGKIVSVSTIVSGDRVRVRPGGPIVVDGVVQSGRSFVQQTAMTGEWQPVLREPGQTVLAGTYAVDGELEIEVVASLGQRRLDAVLAEVAAARLAPSELQREADRLAAIFLPLVVAVATGVMSFWTWKAGWSTGLFNSMSVLLVACPCALGLATPLAVWRGLAGLAELGLVARTGDAIDALAKADYLCIDKTGTLSHDRLAVLELRIRTEWRDRETWLRNAVAAVESRLDHPLARALADCGDPAAAGPVGELRVVPGSGVEAVVTGRSMRIGRPSWVDGALADDEGRMVAVAIDGSQVATIALGEKWRAGLSDVVEELRQMGIAVEVLTGDTAKPDVGLAGVEWRGGLLPAQKRERVAELKRQGRVVVFVGDGINDAPAMSEADTAVAMGGGAALARASAPVVYLGADLHFLPAAIRIGRQMRAGVASNLRFAAGYNAVGMVVAACGLLHPVVAAMLMLGSSIFVSVRSLRVGRTGASA